MPRRNPYPLGCSSRIPSTLFERCVAGEIFRFSVEDCPVRHRHRHRRRRRRRGVACELVAYRCHHRRERIPIHSSQRNSDLDLSVSFSPFLIQKAERFAKLTCGGKPSDWITLSRSFVLGFHRFSHTRRSSARLKNYRIVTKERKPLKAAVKLAKG